MRFRQKRKHTATTKHKIKHKILASAGNLARNLSHRSWVRYCLTTELTESIDWSQAI